MGLDRRGVASAEAAEIRRRRIVFLAVVVQGSFHAVGDGILGTGRDGLEAGDVGEVVGRGKDKGHWDQEAVEECPERRHG